MKNLNRIIVLTITLALLAVFSASVQAGCKPGSCGKGKKCSYSATSGEKTCIDATKKIKGGLKDIPKKEGSRISIGEPPRR